jgi:hypothetical protein
MVHTFARLKFVYASDPDLKRIGLTLEALGRLRNSADYQIGTSGPFVSPRIAVLALTDADSAIARLDAIEADPVRRAGAARTIPPAFAHTTPAGHQVAQAFPVQSTQPYPD